MKKLFVVFFMVASLVMAGNVIAGGITDVTGTGSYAGSNFYAPGYFGGIGNADANVYDLKSFQYVNDFGNTTISIAGSKQKVDSYAWTLSDPWSWNLDRANAFGNASQSSFAGAKEGLNVAFGMQTSNSGYSITDWNPMVAYVNGEAKSFGGTIAIASKGTIGNTKYGAALAATGSIGKANVNGGSYAPSILNVNGSGLVGHQSGVTGSKDGYNAQAYTSGLATYSYYNTDLSCGGRCGSYNSIVGGGGAITGGLSTITRTDNGVNANASSFSFSTGGGQVTAQGSAFVSK